MFIKFITHKNHDKPTLYTLQNNLNTVWRTKDQNGLHVMKFYYNSVNPLSENNMAFLYTNEVHVKLFIRSNTCTDHTAMLSDKNILSNIQS